MNATNKSITETLVDFFIINFLTWTRGEVSPFNAII